MSIIGTAARTETTDSPSAQAAAISFRAISKVFVTPDADQFTAIHGIDLEVEAGSFVCIVGPSGCGKSTLLNMTAGLLQPSSGEVLYRGAPIKGANTDVGYMTQKDNLLPWRTVRKNVLLALEISKTVPVRQRKERVDAVLADVGLGRFADRYPAELSGGMRKRVSLARSLVYSPRTLLMDEPFGALDAQLRLVLQEQLLELWERERKTMLFVTHDIEEAILLADRVVVFGTNPGRIVHVEEITLERPRSLLELRQLPEFNQIWSRLWSLIGSHETKEEQ
ncbi:ABC transporter ATP-binding protein [Nocardioides sp. LHD-245]|uniref:ABC transporter ATP-binding protein n=1 Tax=Nocardioides sp. LHD-245 TaxID=3051387 RepID=UPI0027E0D456|nr:ABC transporter ATP-binding protein [Nocardioides sp. LHD-245]